MASGQVRVSSDYREGQYALHVASPVVGGTYVCRAPGQRAAAACAQGSERPAEAEVKVDSLETNTLLILAELKDLKRVCMFCLCFWVGFFFSQKREIYYKVEI